MSVPKGRKRHALVISGFTVSEIAVVDSELRVYDAIGKRAWLLDRPVPWSSMLCLPGGTSLVPRKRLLFELRSFLARESANARPENPFFMGEAPLWLGPAIGAGVTAGVALLMMIPAMLTKWLG